MGFAEGTTTAKVQLAGKPRELAFSLGAMKRADDLGVLTTDPKNEIQMLLALPAFIWAAMDKENREELPAEDVAEHINAANLGEMLDAFMAIYGAAMPDESAGNATAGAAKKPTPAKKSTLKSSGRLGSTTSA